MQSAGATTRLANTNTSSSARGVYIQTNGATARDTDITQRHSGRYGARRDGQQRQNDNDHARSQSLGTKQDKQQHSSRTDDDIKRPNSKRTIRRRLSDTFRKNKPQNAINEEVKEAPALDTGQHTPVLYGHNDPISRPTNSNSSIRALSEISTDTYTVQQSKLAEKAKKKKRKATSARSDKPSATEQALLDQLYSRLQQPITEEQLIRTLIHRNADLTDRYHPPKVLKSCAIVLS